MPGSEGGCAEKARVHDPRTRDLAAQPTLPGADRVARMLATGTHVLIRVKSDITLPRAGGFLPDGSYYSYLTGGGGRWCLKVRVIEYHVTVCLLYTSPSPRDGLLSRMPSSA